MHEPIFFSSFWPVRESNCVPRIQSRQFPARFLLYFWLALTCLILPVRAVEPWADPDFPVMEGLELWLDASRINEARRGELPLVSLGGALDLWPDASGNKRHLRQPQMGSRPKWSIHEGQFAVQFDGANDFLFASGLAATLTGATLVIRATPRSNAGFFRGLMGFNQTGVNDYVSGMNVDLGPGPSSDLSFLNVEGKGFTGARNLLKSSGAFEKARTITLTTQPGEGVQLRLDGVPQESRPRGDAPLGFEEITVGARFFSNSAEPPHVQGYFDGSISDVLIFSRVLTERECFQVENYLAAKRVSQDAGRVPAPLSGLTNSPPVQMLVPGFTARELPVSLSNINGVKYRADGKLMALGYNGQIWLLSDTNGDGLEDAAALFWNGLPLQQPIGMALTPPGYEHGNGVFVAAKGKVALIVDTDGDDIADREIVVAENWARQALEHGVDALGVAVDRDGSVYFGLGTWNFAGAYQVDAAGKSHYNLQGERGTILKVSPDFSRREIFSTGIRFPVALAFNEAGDLFCTDQEGATWLPNGNPLDELLHVQPGRHYGFPPRHPRHLPNVIDEPSVFDYGPQHQATCGLNFNLPVVSGELRGGNIFGPSWWRGDALVSGYSRGKLWRTKLVSTPVGYVAQNQLIASLNMLAVDAAVSPGGDLIVAVHSGEPDWGSGPNGPGKLYKISYTDRDAPQPVLIWPVNETETSVEFDRPLDPRQLRDLVRQLRLVQGRYVAAGDDFEVLRPGYQVVRDQLAEPRYQLQIQSAVLSAHGRTLTIRTAPRAQAVNYALTLPRFDGAEEFAIDLQPGAPAAASENVPPQFPRIDLAHDLTGVNAVWRGSDGEELWSGWLPHLDTAVARELTAPSETHAALWSRQSGAGELTLRAQLDLRGMLRAETQPGSQLDFRYPDERVTVVFKANVPLRVEASSAEWKRVHARETWVIATPGDENGPRVDAVLTSDGETEPSLEVSWFTAEDSRARALPLRRILVPWAKPATDETGNGERHIPELAGGDWLRGKRLYFSNELSCAQCHLMRGEGRVIGPDLSNLSHRDYASVLKDIVQPSAALNPDHLAYNLELEGGDDLSGIIIRRTEDEIVLANSGGETRRIPRGEIVSMKASSVSLMPEGLVEGLSPEQLKDLMTFLLRPAPLEPAPLLIPGEPPPRSRAELERYLPVYSLSDSAVENKPMRILLAAGPKDHGPGEHDYPLWRERWSKLLALAGDVAVETAGGWPEPDQFAAADVIVFYSNNPGWSAERAGELDAYLDRGGGLVYIHYAVDGHKHCDELAERIGLAWRGGGSRFRHGALQLNFHPNPLIEGMETLDLVDESYWQLVGDEKSIQLLATGIEDGRPRPLMWIKEQGNGRVFVSIPGHFTWTFDDPLFRVLLLRGIAWAGGQPLDRLVELAPIGARLREEAD
jgi:putative heme-binding domain-containing protein